MRAIRTYEVIAAYLKLGQRAIGKDKMERLDCDGVHVIEQAVTFDDVVHCRVACKYLGSDEPVMETVVLPLQDFEMLPTVEHALQELKSFTTEGE